MSETRVQITLDGRPHEAVLVENEDGTLEVRFGDHTVTIRSRKAGAHPRETRVETDTGEHTVQRRDLHRVRIDGEVSTFIIDQIGKGAAGAEVPTTGLDVRPPMPGRIVRLGVEEGDEVEQGDLIAVLEAMKMQNEVTSPAHGVVRKIHVAQGDTVEAHQVILRLGPAEEEPPAEAKKVVA